MMVGWCWLMFDDEWQTLLSSLSYHTTLTHSMMMIMFDGWIHTVNPKHAHTHTHTKLDDTRKEEDSLEVPDSRIATNSIWQCDAIRFWNEKEFDLTMQFDFNGKRNSIWNQKRIVFFVVVLELNFSELSKFSAVPCFESSQLFS